MAAGQEGIMSAVRMKIRILRTAMDDLSAGRLFYDKQQEGVGDYFFDSLFAEIDSLRMAGVMKRSQMSVSLRFLLSFLSICA